MSFYLYFFAQAWRHLPQCQIFFLTVFGGTVATPLSKTPRVSVRTLLRKKEQTNKAMIEPFDTAGRTAFASVGVMFCV